MEIKLFRHQLQTLSSESKFICLLSGVGGGKTWTGCHWVLKNIQKYPKARGFIGANTYGQLRDATLKALTNEMDSMGITYTINKSTGYLSIFGSEIICRSTENYEMLRGAEYGWIWLDEAAYMSKEAFDVLTGRLRDKRGPLQMLMTTTPKGFNWVYDHFHPSGEKNTKDYQLIKARTHDNIFLPDGYIDTIKEQFDPKLAEQELDGEFVNLTQGKCYYAFDRSHIVDLEIDDSLPIYVGMDFNVDPMTATICQIYKDNIHVIGEVFIRNSNTPEMAEILLKNFGKCKIIPDSTGTNRKTSAHTDFQLLKDAGHEVIYSRNPFVVDRINNVNRLFKLNKVKISSNCKKLINDLEKVSWKESGTDIDKTTDKLISHISDGFGYLAWYAMPMYEKKHTKTIQL
jgi:PBSX family phage terminase large subunit